MGIRALVITLLLCFYGYSQNGPNTLHQKEGKIYQLMELDSILMFTGEYDFCLLMLINILFFLKSMQMQVFKVRLYVSLL